jgi:adenosylmethionine-8-amino-7-oxononanoate aminotransferase
MPKSREFLAQQTDHESIRVTKAEGSYVWDDQRRKYIDFTMGWCVGNLGWGVPEIESAVTRHRPASYVYPNYDYQPWHELAELLADITPAELTHSYRATGGSEAVEIALQIAMVATGRGKFVSLEDSYHGNTIATLSIAASESRQRYKNLLPNCQKLRSPLNEKKLDRVKRLLQGRDVAAFIMEPIPLSLGVEIPQPDFMTGLQQLCNRYGTLLIMDEVACGFGRTGALFGTEHYDIRPDIMTMAKAMTCGAAGLGATIVTAKVHRKVKNDFSAYSTYGWHPVAVSAAIANVRYWKKHRRTLLANCNEIGAFIEARLHEMFAGDVDIRAKGWRSQFISMTPKTRNRSWHVAGNVPCC